MAFVGLVLVSYYYKPYMQCEAILSPQHVSICDAFHRIVTKLLLDIIPEIGCLHKLTELVSTLDMLTGFAQVCTWSNYSKLRVNFED